jgi:uncharacterized protein YdeI (YjbR/CyaY-like superfamily)
LRESSRKREAGIRSETANHVTAKSATSAPAKAEIRAFKDSKAWEAWLRKNHRTSSGLWLRLAKKGSGKPSVTHGQALEVALCYGWIDAQARGESEGAWLQRFMPRARKSIWSKINREKALALIAGGRMKPAGLDEVERAREDGRWDAAYDSPRTAAVPADFEMELQKSPRARAFFKTLNSANRYAIIWRLQTAKKAETRAKRMRSFIEMLEKGETIH